MPIEGPSSYNSTVPLFINHWKDANLLGTLITLDKDASGQAADVDVARLEALFAELQSARDDLETVLLDRSLLQAEVRGLQAQVQANATAFNRTIRADHGATPFARVLPKVPQVGDAREKFMKPLRMMSTLWERVDAFRDNIEPVKPPLTLEDGTTQAEFAARLALLEVRWTGVVERDGQAALEREFRNDKQDEIYPILKVYRLKIQAAFPPGHAIVASLPALTPQPGSTPQPGTLAGEWDAAQEKAVFTGTESPSASVVRHQIRATLDDENPTTDDEFTVAEYPVGTPIALATDYGLTAPGEIAHFRLVALTADGHEKGTDWVRIARPV